MRILHLQFLHFHWFIRIIKWSYFKEQVWSLICSRIPTCLPTHDMSACESRPRQQPLLSSSLLSLGLKVCNDVRIILVQWGVKPQAHYIVYSMAHHTILRGTQLPPDTPPSCVPYILASSLLQNFLYSRSSRPHAFYAQQWSIRNTATKPGIKPSHTTILG